MAYEDNFSFQTLSSQSCKKSKNTIVDSFTYHPERGKREKAILEQILRDGANSNTKITVISDSTGAIKSKLGLVALSAAELELDKKKFPALSIDFLFVDNQHRSVVYEYLNVQVSHMLLFYAIQEAISIAERIGLRYLILRPDGGKESENLVKFYKSMRFKYMTEKHEWMYLKLT